MNLDKKTRKNVSAKRNVSPKPSMRSQPTRQVKLLNQNMKLNIVELSNKNTIGNRESAFNPTAGRDSMFNPMGGRETCPP